MDSDSYTKALLSDKFDDLHVERILDTCFHAGVPHVFRGDAEAHVLFRRGIANEISSTFEVKCHPRQVVVCGSAHLGFSAAPNENLGRPFDFERSDVDVAVILPELFDRWWLELVDWSVALGSRRDQIADNLLNGLINPQGVRGFTKTGEKWWGLFGRIATGRLDRVSWFSVKWNNRCWALASQKGC
jgi:hypothetical protein